MKKMLHLFIAVRSLFALFNIIHFSGAVLKHAESNTFVWNK